jgi:DNA (cytosine-5)-methyltransferase 1
MRSRERAVEESFGTNGHQRDDREFLQRKVRPSYESGGVEVTLVDLFSGCGGMALGVAHAAYLRGRAIRIPLAIDHDESAVGVFRDNFPGSGCLRDDVCEWFAPAFEDPLTPKEKETRKWLGTGIDFLVGGPPCQGNSNLNNHTRRKDPRNALYARMARAARVLEPRMVVIENVPTVVNDHGKVVDATHEALERDGYEVAQGVVKLWNLGLPQLRKRHVLLASRDETFDPEVVLESSQDDSEGNARDLRWAIGDLVDVPAESGFDAASVPSPDNARRIRWLFEEDAYDLPNHLRPPCHQNGSHTYNSIYGRLRWDRPAQTITTGFNSIGQGRNIHPSRRRTITPHEAARLQFLPDFFSFGAVDKRGVWARLIGNAVPPLLTMRIAERAFDHVGIRQRMVES